MPMTTPDPLAVTVAPAGMAAVVVVQTGTISVALAVAVVVHPTCRPLQAGPGVRTPSLLTPKVVPTELVRELSSSIDHVTDS